MKMVSKNVLYRVTNLGIGSYLLGVGTTAVVFGVTGILRGILGEENIKIIEGRSRKEAPIK